MQLDSDSKFLLIGDSITDAGRDESGEPTPWSPATGLGQGYVEFFNALLVNADPARRIRVVNHGVSGNTVRDLAARWQQDVIAVQPDWLAIAIGVNDVWRQFDTPLRDAGVPPDEFRRTYQQLITSARRDCPLQGLVLITPFVVEPNRSEPFRQRMDDYRAIVAELATEHQALLVDSQAALDRLCATLHPCELAWDRIHLSAVGHMALAQALLAAVSKTTASC